MHQNKLVQKQYFFGEIIEIKDFKVNFKIQFLKNSIMT